jgi:hypothetical protein
VEWLTNEAASIVRHSLTYPIEQAMSTSTTTPVASSGPRLSRAILRRCVWKEYRMLRGLWLAVLVMAVIIQWSMNFVLPRQVDHATMLFATALAAAVLYAVGAAATTFSVEHEEDTYGYLSGLPTEWWPVFAGKLLMVAASAVLLAAVLCAVGWLLCRLSTPGGNDMPMMLGVIGFAIVEAIAWGTLFSLLVKRPLLAAILTLVVGGAAVNAAVNLASERAVASTVPEAYIEAIPVRLAIVLCVFAVSVLLGRNWLNVAQRPGRAVGFGSLRGLAAGWYAVGARFGLAADAKVRFSRLGMLARLLWQTWRESWKLLLVPLLVAVVLTAVIWLTLSVAFLGFRQSGEELAIIVAPLHFIPALYGAMAFYIDQRRGGYRFLAEHAARARMVWFARNLMWFSALIALYVVAVVLIGLFIANESARHMQDALTRYLRHGEQTYFTSPQYFLELAQAKSFLFLALGLAGNGLVAAYAIGQLCSMFVRSEILAAFFAVVMSVVLSAWVAALFAWQLSGWLFLLPLAIGLFAATWLRAPDWIAGRNGWRAWGKPILAIAAACGLVGVLLPIVRLGQLPPRTRDSHMTSASSVDSKAAAALQETAGEYMKVAERLAAGPVKNLMERWETPERTWAYRGALEERIPAEEMEAFREAERKQLALMRANIAEAVAAAIELSKRPACRFEFHLDMTALNPTNAHPELSLGAYPPYEKLTRLLETVLFAPQMERSLNLFDDEPTSESDRFSFIERAMAALRMSAHIRNGQPSVVFLAQLEVEREILGYIGDWAQQEGRTEEELRYARSQLEEHFRTAGHSISATAPLLADAGLVYDVITGKASSIAQALEPRSLPVHLAYLANGFPWERERALRALDRITSYNLDAARYRDWSLPQESWVIAEPQAATSYLARFEYLARNSRRQLGRAEFDTIAVRRATLLRLALARYRLEHGEYPARLQKLVPDYVSKRVTLNDPYSERPFQYEPQGLDLPLNVWGWLPSNAIQPNTPFFWSVGPADMRLSEGSMVVSDPNDEDAEGRAVQQYSLYIYDYATWFPGDAALVFPLTPLDRDQK